MKKLIYLLLCSPVLLFSQTPSEYLIFEIATMNIGNDHVDHVESAMGAHNKKYHPSGPSGVRVYNVVTGPNSGQYKWVMGPGPWSALDNRPDDDAHNSDWENNVARYLEPGGNVEYIKYDPKLSRFPADFNVSKLLVWYVDVKRGKTDELKGVLEKIHKVYKDKIPAETYGIYFNELPSTSSKRDLVIVSFFDKYAWMGTDVGFDAKYEEVHGKGSLEDMWNSWNAFTEGSETEIWEFREDLSGLPPMVKAAERQ